MVKFVMKPQHVTIVVSVKNFIRVHGLNIASFQYCVSEIDAKNWDVLYIYIYIYIYIYLTKFQNLSDETGSFFLNLRFYVEMLMNWNGKVVILFNHKTRLSNLSLLCDVSQHLIYTYNSSSK